MPERPGQSIVLGLGHWGPCSRGSPPAVGCILLATACMSFYLVLALPEVKQQHTLLLFTAASSSAAMMRVRGYGCHKGKMQPVHGLPEASSLVRSTSEIRMSCLLIPPVLQSASGHGVSGILDGFAISARIELISKRSQPM